MGIYRKALAEVGKPFPADAPIFKECPMPKDESLSVPYEDLARDRFIMGTPDECRAEIERYHRVLGVSHFLLRLQWPGMPQRLVQKRIELVGQGVIPALKRG